MSRSSLPRVSGAILSKLNWEQAKGKRKASGVDRGSDTDCLKSPAASYKQLRYLESLAKQLGFQSAASFLQSIHASPVPTKRGAWLAITEAKARLDSQSPV